MTVPNGEKPVRSDRLESFKSSIISLFSKSNRKHSVTLSSGTNSKSCNTNSEKVKSIKPFSRLKTWTKDKLEYAFEKKVTWIDDNDQTIVIKVSDLALKLGISKLSILEYIEKEQIFKLKNLERLSKIFNLPLTQLVKKELNGQLDNYLINASNIEKKSHEACKKLDELYEDLKGNLMSQDKDGMFQNHISIQELESIKKVVKIAYRALALEDDPDTKESVKIISTEHNHHILVKSSATSIDITGLFGKRIGEGMYGMVIHTVDLLAGKLVSGEEAILKQPKYQLLMDGEVQKDEALRERNLIDKIHGQKKIILGIQKPLKVIKNIFIPNSTIHCHLGALYQTDLEDILHVKPSKPDEIPKEKRVLKEGDQISLAYQLLHGITHMHANEITHGDIKPANIFCNFLSGDQQKDIGPLLFLSDFGSGIDHAMQDSVTQISEGTADYRVKDDNIARDAARSANDSSLYKEIEKKADVFATCSTIFSFFTNMSPFEGIPIEGNCIVDKNFLQNGFEGKGLSQPTIDLLIRGLSMNYKERPNAAEILFAMQKDLESSTKISPERIGLLLDGSQPLF